MSLVCAARRLRDWLVTVGLALIGFILFIGLLLVAACSALLESRHGPDWIGAIAAVLIAAATVLVLAK